MIIGFSTSCFYKFLPTISREVILVCKKLGALAIEIGSGADDRINAVKNIRPEEVEDFKYKSFHAPDFWNNNSEEDIRKKLFSLAREQERLGFNSIVFHPDLVKDYSSLKKFKIKAAIENMDKYKKFGGRYDEIRSVLEKYKLKLVLDLNHCYTKDKTMKQAEELISNFQDKICEIHLSGFGGKNNLHSPLFKTKQINILKFIPRKNIPIIIESTLRNIEEAGFEISYIKKFLAERDNL